MVQSVAAAVSAVGEDAERERLIDTGGPSLQPSRSFRSRVKHFLNDSWLRAGLKNLCLILAWYLLSTSLGLYNKQLVGKDHGAFPAPLLMSSVQFGVQALIAKAVFGARLLERSRKQALPWGEWARCILPNGLVTGLDIGLSNMSLVFITMSFYTMCKSTVPVFLLAFAFMWRIERPSWELAGVVAVIVTGLALLVKGEASFDPMGFGLVMCASACSGLRFTLTQVLLHGHAHSATAALGGPLEVLELLTPVMCVCVGGLSVAWEHPWTLPGTMYFADQAATAATVGLVVIGASIAFLMVWVEYQVIKETSALTFMIAGTVKEVVTVMAAVAVMGDRLTAVNVVGLCIVISGVLLFNLYKYRRMRAGHIPQYTLLKGTQHDQEDARSPEIHLQPLTRINPPSLLRDPPSHGSGNGSLSAAAAASNAAVSPLHPSKGLGVRVTASGGGEYEALLALPLPAGVMVHR